MSVPQDLHWQDAHLVHCREFWKASAISFENPIECLTSTNGDVTL